MSTKLTPRRSTRQLAAVLLRYTIPMVGVYAFDWSPLLILLAYWFDAVIWLLCILLFTIPGVKRDLDHPVSPTLFLFTYVLTYALMGAPFWLYLGLFNNLVETRSIAWAELLANPSIYVAAAGIVVGCLSAIVSSGLATLPELARKSLFNWEYSLALTRIIVMLGSSLVLPLDWLFVPIIAFLLIELYPLRAMNLVGAPVSEKDRTENIAV